MRNMKLNWTSRRPKNREPCRRFLLATIRNSFSIAHSSGCKASRIPSSSQNRRPSNFARIAREETYLEAYCSLLIVPVMISSSSLLIDCRKTRSETVSTSGSAQNSKLRTAMASWRACADTFPSLTCRGMFASHHPQPARSNRTPRLLLPTQVATAAAARGTARQTASVFASRERSQ